jgi:hypothetical protein
MRKHKKMGAHWAIISSFLLFYIMWHNPSHSHTPQPSKSPGHTQIWNPAPPLLQVRRTFQPADRLSHELFCFHGLLVTVSVVVVAAVSMADWQKRVSTQRADCIDLKTFATSAAHEWMMQLLLRAHVSLSVLSRPRPATPLAMDFSLSLTFRPNKGLQGGIAWDKASLDRDLVLILYSWPACPTSRRPRRCLSGGAVGPVLWSKVRV